MKRFYREVTVAPEGSGWRVLLDGRGVKTAMGQQQVVPSRVLADAMAEEWAGQGEEIDTSAFILRDLADYAIDIVAADRESAIKGLLPYGETDTLCYRGDAGDRLVFPVAGLVELLPRDVEPIARGRVVLLHRETADLRTHLNGVAPLPRVDLAARSEDREDEERDRESQRVTRNAHPRSMRERFAGLNPECSSRLATSTPERSR